MLYVLTVWRRGSTKVQSLHTNKHDKLIRNQSVHGCMCAGFAPCTHTMVTNSVL